MACRSGVPLVGPGVERADVAGSPADAARQAEPAQSVSPAAVRAASLRLEPRASAAHWERPVPVLPSGAVEAVVEVQPQPEDPVEEAALAPTESGQAWERAGPTVQALPEWERYGLPTVALSAAVRKSWAGPVAAVLPARSCSSKAASSAELAWARLPLVAAVSAQASCEAAPLLSLLRSRAEPKLPEFPDSPKQPRPHASLTTQGC